LNKVSGLSAASGCQVLGRPQAASYGCMNMRRRPLAGDATRENEPDRVFTFTLKYRL